MKLITIPYAGGNKFSLAGLNPFLKDDVEIINVELSGRGARMSEARHTSIPEMVDDLFKTYKHHFSGKYALYGHSLGGTLGHLLIRRLTDEGYPLPLYFFVTGNGAPRSKETNKLTKTPRHLMTDAEFKAELRNMGGCPKEVLNNEQLMDFFTPILKDDFKAIESYTYTRDVPYNVPLLVIVGTEESYTDEDIALWGEETCADFHWFRLPGNHFFILNHFEKIAQLIKESLKKEVKV